MIELTPEERTRANGLDASKPGNGPPIGGEFFDRDGDRITMGEWTVLFARGSDYRLVRVDDVGKWRISTVWLGLDHGVPGGNPETFETMVFHEDTDSEGHLTQRYTTEAEARDGHAEIVSKLSRST